MPLVQIGHMVDAFHMPAVISLQCVISIFELGVFEYTWDRLGIKTVLVSPGSPQGSQLPWNERSFV